MPYKIVNIEAKMKIGIVDPPIYGRERNKKMSYGEILKCLAMRAIIDEVMPDGSTVRLNMTNYHYDFVGEWERTHNKPEPVYIKAQEVVKPTVVSYPPSKSKEKVDKKKEDKNPTNSKEIVEEVPEAPISVEEVKAPVVETTSESSADNTPVEDNSTSDSHKNYGFNRPNEKK